MRSWLLKSLLKQADDPLFIFLTGDLGFHFLEPLREKMGRRFINCGVAEQHMVSMAAGLAKQGFHVCAYSISPFLFARAFEQIRIDINYSRLPVQLIGSGAGYDYGAQGPEHHALEDYGVLGTLTNLDIYLPWNETSLEQCLDCMWTFTKPGYLRLDRRALAMAIPASATSAWTEMTRGLRTAAESPAVSDLILCVGSAVVPYVEACQKRQKPLPLWVLDRLPITAPPVEFLEQVKGRNLHVLEEHVQTGGVYEKLAALFYGHASQPRQIYSHAVHDVFSGRFGSREYHWQENGLLPEQVFATIDGRSRT